MICHDCRRDLHDRCRGGSWCTCQHRTGPAVRMRLGDAAALLRTAGYGNPLEVNDGAA